MLTRATVADEGTAAYERNHNAIRDAVATASRILLYVHGIIGDTRGMVSSARPEHLALGTFVEPVGTWYQLLLAFDYENINTPIGETAGDLKARLAAVGLGERHGKTLDVVAHSMGGLVTRWMIEREGGDTIVNRLVTLGTPNGGSPWPTLETCATTLLALGLNGLAGAFWPAAIPAGLAGALEKVDVALDQMTSQLYFLTKLAAAENDDPPVPEPREVPLTLHARNATAETALGLALCVPKRASTSRQRLAAETEPIQHRFVMKNSGRGWPLRDS